MPPEGDGQTVILLSGIVFLPAIVAGGLLFVPKRFAALIKGTSVAATAVVFLATLYLLLAVSERPLPGNSSAGSSLPEGQSSNPLSPQRQSRPTLSSEGQETAFPGRSGSNGKDSRSPDQGPFLREVSTADRGTLRLVVRRPWIPAFGVEYLLGVDGISLPLVLLTSFLSLLAMLASWTISQHEKAYCILFLLLETGLLGVFLALDFFLFYVFWEVTLLPMYFLIGVWGGPRREYAAVKFFLFTLAGSVLILVAMLMLYFSSDLRLLAPSEQKACYVAETPESQDVSAEQPRRTFNLLALAALGQNRLEEPTGPAAHSASFDPSPKENSSDSSHLGARTASGESRPITGPLDQVLLWGKSVQWWAFLLLLIGFLVKVPSVPVHTWLPDAHVEAPTPISMLLAGVLLKMGGYGLMRIAYPICPAGAYELAWLVCTLGVLSMIYGALAAMAQKDFKRLVAYSSVSHMGYVVLGLGAWSATAARSYGPDAWVMSASGALFQMIAHGITSAGMFFLVGVIYDRVHHRNLDQMGGLLQRMPTFGGLSIVIFFGAMGLPGLCGFVGEILVLLGVWHYSASLAVLGATVVILTAGYILWTVQRVYLGSEYRGPHPEALQPMTPREVAVGLPLAVLAVVLGVYPQAVFSYAEPSVRQTIQSLADWTRRQNPPVSAPRPVSAPVGLDAARRPVCRTEHHWCKQTSAFHEVRR